MLPYDGWMKKEIDYRMKEEIDYSLETDYQMDIQRTLYAYA